MRLLPVLTILLLAGAASPTASIAQLEPDCSDWDNLPQQGMNRCAQIAYQEADTELNQVWQNLRERYRGDPTWDAILAAQRTWIPFRDAHCEAHAAPWESGSMQPFIRSTCLTAATKHRIGQLRDFLQDP